MYLCIFIYSYIHTFIYSYIYSHALFYLLLLLLILHYFYHLVDMARQTNRTWAVWLGAGQKQASDKTGKPFTIMAYRHEGMYTMYSIFI